MWPLVDNSNSLSFHHHFLPLSILLMAKLVSNGSERIWSQIVVVSNFQNALSKHQTMAGLWISKGAVNEGPIYFE